jgi:hypothetical protein
MKTLPLSLIALLGVSHALAATFTPITQDQAAQIEIAVYGSVAPVYASGSVQRGAAERLFEIALTGLQFDPSLTACLRREFGKIASDFSQGGTALGVANYFGSLSVLPENIAGRLATIKKIAAEGQAMTFQDLREAGFSAKFAGASDDFATELAVVAAQKEKLHDWAVNVSARCNTPGSR